MPSVAPAAEPRAGGDLHVQLLDVSKRYGGRLILDRISLAIQPGETVALIGPSGGGKSTLLRCLNGLNTFDSGQIRVGDHLLTPAAARSNSPSIQALRRVFGMVFQDFQLFPHLTALQNITEAPRRVLGLPHAQAAQRGQQLLDMVGLSAHHNAWPRQLSGGQQQRVAIARALAMQPRGLLCDEITSALDPELKHEVLEVLERLKHAGMTLLVVTHEIGFARRAADRVVVLGDGRILEDGPPEQVLDQPRSDRVRAFLSRVLA